MKKVIVLAIALFFLGIQVLLTFYIKSAWIFLGSLLLMGFFIVTNTKELALAIVLAMFGYGSVLATMGHQEYVSHKITLMHNLVIDKRSGKRFKIAAEEFHAEEKPHENSPVLICEGYTLFGRATKDRFCYLRKGSNLYRLEEVGV